MIARDILLSIEVEVYGQGCDYSFATTTAQLICLDSLFTGNVSDTPPALRRSPAIVGIPYGMWLCLTSGLIQATMHMQRRT
jgi:hypothetical protein